MPLLFLGLADNWIFAAIGLSVLITAVCMVYGIVRWNKGSNRVASTETIVWVRDEDEINKEF